MKSKPVKGNGFKYFVFYETDPYRVRFEWVPTPSKKWSASVFRMKESQRRKALEVLEKTEKRIRQT
jgi:hypothetical protein